MVTIYKEVCKRLEQIDFEALWPQFHSYPFALYTKKEAVMNGVYFSTPASFYGNTAILWNGQRTAIWNIELDPPKSLDHLTADLVHEMFHAFQTERGERRFPNDLTLFAATQTAESLSWKIWERNLLADGAPLPQFCAARLERRNNPLTREEELVETAEGMAQFVELRALGQLSDSLLLDSLERCRMHLRDASRAVDVRRCGYDSGMYMLWRAVESGMNIYHNIGQEVRSVFEFLSHQIPGILHAVLPDESVSKTAAILLRRQRQQQNAEMAGFLQTTPRRVNGPFEICGYDPMNMWRQENILFSRGFVALKNAYGEITPMQGKVLLNMEAGSDHIAVDYFISE